MKLPKKDLTNAELESARDIEELACVPFEVVSIPSTEYSGGVAIIEVEGTRLTAPLESYESTPLIFAKHNFARFSHLPNIYQLYLRLLTDSRLVLTRAVIEDKAGDVLYARIYMEHLASGFEVHTACSVGTALNLAMIAECETFIVRRVIPLLELADEWPSEYDVSDEGDEFMI